MTEHDYLSDEEAYEMMDGILAEAEDPTSPVVTPFLIPGSDDPAAGMVDAGDLQAHAELHDIWEQLRAS